MEKVRMPKRIRELEPTLREERKTPLGQKPKLGARKNEAGPTSWARSLLSPGATKSVLRKFRDAMLIRIDALGDPKSMTEEQVARLALMTAILITDDEQFRLRSVSKFAELTIPKPGDKSRSPEQLTEMIREFLASKQQAEQRQALDKRRVEQEQHGQGKEESRTG